MIARLNAWLRGRSPRERWLLGIAAAMLGLMLLWLLVIQPTYAIRDKARARQDAAAVALADTVAMVLAAKTMGTEPKVQAGESLVDAVRRSATAAGFTVAGIEQEGEGARLSIAAARSPAIFQWLRQAQAVEGLTVRRFSAQRNQDATIAVEMVLGR